MINNKFEELELYVMKRILSGDDPVRMLLREQFSHASIASREFTGVGFFTNFLVPMEIARITDKALKTLPGIDVKIKGLQYGAGFQLFLKDGAIDYLEGFTYDEKWPEIIQDFSIQNDIQ